MRGALDDRAGHCQNKPGELYIIWPSDPATGEFFINKSFIHFQSLFFYLYTFYSPIHYFRPLRPHIATMKFTGLIVSIVLSSLGYSTALPVLGNVEGTFSSIEGAVGGVTGSTANIVAPVTSTAHGLTGALKRDDTQALGGTVETIPSLAKSGIAIAGSAVGTGESLVSGAAGTVENAAAGSPTKRQLNDLVGSTVPAIIQESKAGGLARVLKRDGTAALGETIETIPSLANSGIAIAGSAVGTGESLVSGTTGTAENAVGHT